MSVSYESFVTEPLHFERFPVEDGMVAVPTGPGLGITLDEEVFEACRIEVRL